MTKKQASGTPATRLLTSAGVNWTSHPYDHDTRAQSYGLEAAAALGVEARQVFKTLLAVCDDSLTVAVVPVDTTLDLKALARVIGAKKATMADPAQAERSTGYVVGGISPLGQKRALPTVIDDSAVGWPAVYVSGGRRGLDVSLAPHDLVALTDATLASIARRPG